MPPLTILTALLILTPTLLNLTLTAADLTSDAAALTVLRLAVGRSVLPSWNSSVPTCQWQGVTCDAPPQRVTVLRLPGVGLIGSIPAQSIGNLTALRTLSLRFNALSGPLPEDFTQLQELRNLYLQQNRFSGQIPESLGDLKNLVRLNLAGNRFSGEIPRSLGRLSRLGTALLENNLLSGEIPELSDNVTQFNISNNPVNGSIPRGLRKFSASSFLGTAGLCGGPLGPCPGEISPEPSPEGTGNGVRKSRKLSGGAIAGIVIAAVAVLALLVVIVCVFCRRGARKTKAIENGETAVGTGPVEAEDKGIGNVGETARGIGNAAALGAAGAAGKGAIAPGAKKLVFFRGGEGPFDLEDLLRASAEVLGKGTFGTAYKAVLESGVTVAVKRLKDVSLSEGEFREKIEVVGAMNHPKLVPLRAYYFSKDEKLLVYDFMTDGSLSALLHGNRGSGRTPLNWETRLDIALSAAQGIEYIHSTGPSASHGNIKSSNILLAKSEARVSDHGLALIVGPSSTPTRVAGYRAPEVTDLRKISQKADVYSFGVLLLELLTGKAPAQAALNEEGVDLPRWVQSVVREEWTAEVFDIELLRYQNVEEEMVQLLQLAIDCTAQYPDKRPAISDVVVRIEEIKRSSLGMVNQSQTNRTSSIEGDDISSRADSIEAVKPAGSES